jgi:hypothetical protein
MTTPSVNQGMSMKNTRRQAKMNAENDANLLPLALEDSLTRDPSLEHKKNALQQSIKNQDQEDSSPPREETRDEENESIGDDSFVYSDDSASLSDAYFFPQLDDIPHRYRNDPLQQLNSQYPLASFYGSMDRSAPTHIGSIQETEEMQAADLPKMGNTRVFKKERRRRRRKLLSSREQIGLVSTACRREQPIGETVRCNDWSWALLFIAQFTLVLCLGLHTFLIFLQEFSSSHIYMPWNEKVTASSLSYNSASGEMQYTDDAFVPSGAAQPIVESGTMRDTSFTIEFVNLLAIICISGTLSCWIASFSFVLMLVLARSLIYIVLIFSVFLALIWTMIGLSFDPYGIKTITGFSILFLTLGYTIFNWNRVPFAAANLSTAMSALRCTGFVSILGLSMLGLTFLWCIVWVRILQHYVLRKCESNLTLIFLPLQCMAFFGVADFVNSVHHHEKGNGYLLNEGIAIFLYSFLLFSFCWTTTTITNISKVTMSYVVGAWCFLPGDIKFCGPETVLQPLSRALTYWLGSLSLGSIATLLINLLAVIKKFYYFFEKAHHDVPESTHGNSRLTPSHKTRDQSSDSSVLEQTTPSSCSPRWANAGDLCNASYQSCSRWAYVFIGMCE